MEILLIIQTVLILVLIGFIWKYIHTKERIRQAEHQYTETVEQLSSITGQTVKTTKEVMDLIAVLGALNKRKG